MTNAQKIWEAFKGELIVEPTDDMREALSTVIRAVAEEIYHDPDVHFLYKLADEMDTLETDH